MKLSTAGPIRLVEVGPRDGLQNEKNSIPLDAKIAFVDKLSQTGLAEIEVGAFVRPDLIPQMSDTAAVLESIARRPGVLYSALVPNEQGLDRALEAEIDKVAVFTAVSETFNQKNVNATIEQSLERFKIVVRAAHSAHVPVRAYVSTAFWCPYEGKIAPFKALDVCKKLMDMGVDELSIGDTIGKASPRDVQELLKTVLPETGLERLFLHFHDTYGMAIANVLCAWTEFGVTGFDAAAGGLGGCPFAPGASGNVATEDLLFALASSGAQVPAEPAAVAAAAHAITPHLDHPLCSKLSRIFPSH